MNVQLAVSSLDQSTSLHTILVLYSDMKNLC